MYNFEHEVASIDDRYVRYFLESDYFHDGIIGKIQFPCDVNQEQIEISISCEREWARDCTYAYQNNLAKPDMFDERYLYKLTFQNCKYLETTVLESGAIYINGRFKNSIQLYKVAEKLKRRLYHFRIQLNAGFIDIIFSKFTIYKVTGEIVIPNRISRVKHIFPNAIQQYQKVSLNDVRNCALHGSCWDKYYAIQYLSLHVPSDLVDIGLAGLKSEDEMNQIASVYVLGKCGGYNELLILINLWLTEDDPLFRRHILDAIEKVAFRVGGRIT
jgi:hypothetical protein